jgi:hypothetical protein
MVLMLGLLLLGLLAVGCRDKEKEVEAMLEPTLDAVLPLVERDTKQVRDGLPKGAALMAKHLDEDPSSDLEGVKRAIGKARAGVDELVVAKSTFFVFVDAKGVVLRSEVEPDLPAGKSLVDAIPDTKAVLAPDAKLIEAWGFMEGLRGVNKGGDLQWVVGHPVRTPEGKLQGAFITGWSLRKYALYLEEHAQRELTAKQEDKSKASPLLYAFVVKGKQAFGGPMTPDENAQAVGELDLPSKAKDGLFKTTLEIDGRRFLLAAKPAKALADDVFVVVMMSPV